MSEDFLTRAQLLLQQERYDLAEEYLGQCLRTSPDDAAIYQFLALCYNGQKKFQEATAAAKKALELDPTDSYSHYVMADCLLKRNRFKEAIVAIKEAIEIDPFHPDFWGVLAHLHLASEQWTDALEAAEKGLEVDPENVACTNVRAIALRQLGRADEANRQVDDMLTQRPDDPTAHANRGWSLLHQGKTKEALESFQEALRLEPGNAWAREGLVTALKSKYFFYRILLGYYFWMSRLSGNARWGVVIGGYVVFRITRNVAANNPDLSPYLMPFIGVYIAFALLTWLGDPIFSFMLRMSRYGRNALAGEEKLQSTLVMTCFGLALSFGIATWIAYSQSNLVWVPLVYVTIAFACAMLPLSAVFNCSPGWPRNLLVGATALVCLAGLGAAACIGLAMSVGEPLNMALADVARTLSSACIYGGIGSQFAAMYLTGVTLEK